MIPYPFLLLQTHGHVIEIGLFRRPVSSRKMERAVDSLFLKHIKSHCLLLTAALHRTADDLFFTSGDHDHNPGRRSRMTPEPVIDPYGPLVNIRRKMDPLKSGLLHRLQPDALPDTGAGRIPDKLGSLLPELLSSGYFLILQRICDLHAKMLFPALQQLRDIKAERRLSSPVFSCQPAVDQDSAAVIHCPKIQQDLFALPVPGNPEGSLVDHLVFPDPLSDPAQSALAYEGHLDLPLLTLYIKIPCTV